MDIINTLRNNKSAKLAVIESIALLAIFFILYQATIMGMLELWLTSETYSHGLFIVPLTAVLVYQRLKRQPLPQTTQPLKHIIIPALGIIVVSSLWLISSLAHINLLAQLSVVALIPLAIWIRYGFAAVWLLKGALGFLFLAVPVGDFLIPHLQDITAVMSIFMIEMVGIPVYHDGLYISIPAGNFLVAEACSGIRFLISAITIAIFYSLLYMRSLKRRLIMTLCGAIVPVVANGIRVFLIIVIAHLSDMEAATGFDHLVYGWVFFSFVMVLLIILGNILADKDYADNQHTQPTTDTPSAQLASSEPVSFSAILPLYLVITLSLAIAPLALNVIKSAQPQPVANSVAKQLIEESVQLYNRSSTSWAVYFPNADDIVHQRVGRHIETYTVTYLFESDTKELVNYENRLFNPDRWSLRDRTMSKLDIAGQPVSVLHLVIVNLFGQERHLYLTYKVGNVLTAQVPQIKVQQVLHKLTQQDFGGTALILSATTNQVTPEEIQQRFIEFVQSKLNTTMANDRTIGSTNQDK